jgi:hypothetical protein
MTRARRERPYKDGCFSLVNDEAILTEKYRNLMWMPWRIWEICIARANNWGHAAFRKGELVKLCLDEDTPNNRLAVKRAMRVLVKMERIAPMDKHGSTVFCIIVNQGYVWRGGGHGARKDMCSEPEHMDMRETPWTTIEPAEPKDAWDDAEDVKDETDHAEDEPGRDERPTPIEAEPTGFRSWKTGFEE